MQWSEPVLSADLSPSVSLQSVDSYLKNRTSIKIGELGKGTAKNRTSLHVKSTEKACCGDIKILRTFSLAKCDENAAQFHSRRKRRPDQNISHLAAKAVKYDQVREFAFTSFRNADTVDCFDQTVKDIEEKSDVWCTARLISSYTAQSAWPQQRMEPDLLHHRKEHGFRGIPSKVHKFQKIFGEKLHAKGLCFQEQEEWAEESSCDCLETAKSSNPGIYTASVPLLSRAPAMLGKEKHNEPESVGFQQLVSDISFEDHIAAQSKVSQMEGASILKWKELGLCAKRDCVQPSNSSFLTTIDIESAIKAVQALLNQDIDIPNLITKVGEPTSARDARRPLLYSNSSITRKAPGHALFEPDISTNQVILPDIAKRKFPTVLEVSQAKPELVAESRTPLDSQCIIHASRTKPQKWSPQSSQRNALQKFLKQSKSPRTLLTIGNSAGGHTPVQASKPAHWNGLLKIVSFGKSTQSPVTNSAMGCVWSSYVVVSPSAGGDEVSDVVIERLYNNNMLLFRCLESSRVIKILSHSDRWTGKSSKILETILRTDIKLRNNFKMITHMWTVAVEEVEDFYVVLLLRSRERETSQKLVPKNVWRDVKKSGNCIMSLVQIYEKSVRDCLCNSLDHEDLATKVTLDTVQLLELDGVVDQLYKAQVGDCHHLTEEQIVGGGESTCKNFVSVSQSYCEVGLKGLGKQGQEILEASSKLRCMTSSSLEREPDKKEGKIEQSIGVPAVSPGYVPLVSKLNLSSVATGLSVVSSANMHFAVTPGRKEQLPVCATERNVVENVESCPLSSPLEKILQDNPADPPVHTQRSLTLFSSEVKKRKTTFLMKGMAGTLTCIPDIGLSNVRMRTLDQGQHIKITSDQLNKNALIWHADLARVPLSSSSNVAPKTSALDCRAQGAMSALSALSKPVLTAMNVSSLDGHVAAGALLSPTVGVPSSHGFRDISGDVVISAAKPPSASPLENSVQLCGSTGRDLELKTGCHRLNSCPKDQRSFYLTSCNASKGASKGVKPCGMANTTLAPVAQTTTQVSSKIAIARFTTPPCPVTWLSAAGKLHQIRPYGPMLGGQPVTTSSSMQLLRTAARSTSSGKVSPLRFVVPISRATRTRPVRCWFIKQTGAESTKTPGARGEGPKILVEGANPENKRNVAYPFRGVRNACALSTATTSQILAKRRSVSTCRLNSTATSVTWSNTGNLPVLGLGKSRQVPMFKFPVCSASPKQVENAPKIVAKPLDSGKIIWSVKLCSSSGVQSATANSLGGTSKDRPVFQHSCLKGKQPSLPDSFEKLEASRIKSALAGTAVSGSVARTSMCSSRLQDCSNPLKPNFTDSVSSVTHCMSRKEIAPIQHAAPMSLRVQFACSEPSSFRPVPIDHSGMTAVSEHVGGLSKIIPKSSVERNSLGLVDGQVESTANMCQSTIAVAPENVSTQVKTDAEAYGVPVSGSSKHGQGHGQTWSGSTTCTNESVMTAVLDHVSTSTKAEPKPSEVKSPVNSKHVHEQATAEVLHSACSMLVPATPEHTIAVKTDIDMDFPSVSNSDRKPTRDFVEDDLQRISGRSTCSTSDVPVSLNSPYKPSSSCGNPVDGFMARLHKIATSHGETVSDMAEGCMPSLIEIMQKQSCGSTFQQRNKPTNGLVLSRKKLGATLPPFVGKDKGQGVCRENQGSYYPHNYNLEGQINREHTTTNGDEELCDCPATVFYDERKSGYNASCCANGTGKLIASTNQGRSCDDVGPDIAGYTLSPQSSGSEIRSGNMVSFHRQFLQCGASGDPSSLVRGDEDIRLSKYNIELTPEHPRNVKKTINLKAFVSRPTGVQPVSTKSPRGRSRLRARMTRKTAIKLLENHGAGSSKLKLKVWNKSGMTGSRLLDAVRRTVKATTKKDSKMRVKMKKKTAREIMQQVDQPHGNFKVRVAHHLGISGKHLFYAIYRAISVQCRKDASPVNGRSKGSFVTLASRLKTRKRTKGVCPESSSYGRVVGAGRLTKAEEFLCNNVSDEIQRQVRVTEGCPAICKDWNKSPVGSIGKRFRNIFDDLTYAVSDCCCETT